MTAFIRDGHFARHIRKMRMLCMQRRAALVEANQNQMSDKLQVIGKQRRVCIWAA